MHTYAIYGSGKALRFDAHLDRPACVFDPLQRFMGQRRAIRPGIDIAGFAQFLNQRARMIAAIDILVRLDQRLGGVAETGPRRKIGVRSKVQTVQNASPDMRVYLHHGGGPQEAPLIYFGDNLASCGFVRHVVVVMPRMIQRPARPAGHIAVPIKQPLPVVRGNARVLLGQKTGVRSGPVIGPPLVQRPAFERADQPGRRMVQQGMRVLVPQNVGVFGVVYAARAEPQEPTVRNVYGIIPAECLRINMHRKIEDSIADIQRLCVAAAFVDMIIGVDSLEPVVGSRKIKGVGIGYRRDGARVSLNADVRPLQPI